MLNVIPFPGSLRDLADRENPRNEEAEQGILGALLASNRVHEKVAGFLKPEHFYDPVHQRIYEAIGRLIDRGGVADAVTLRQYFENDPALAGVGGAGYLAELQGCVVSLIGSEHYARTVHDLAMRRRLVDVAADMIATATSPDTEVRPADVIASAEMELFRLAETGTSPKPRRMSEFADEHLADILAAQEAPGGIVGLSTGLVDLDEALRGLKAPDLIIIAGRPAMGKSALALNISSSVARKDGKPLFISEEMSGKQLAARMIADLTGISVQDQFGRLEPAQLRDISNATEALRGMEQWVEETPALSIAKVRSIARRHKLQHGLDLLTVDYLQLLNGGDVGRQGNRTQEIDAISQGLKAIAKELHVPVIALSQLSRAVESREDKRPRMSDLRECLAGDALVIDAETGARVAICDIVERKLRFNVWAMDARLRLSRKPIVDAWAVGEKPVFKVATATGRTIRCTDGHRFLTASGWKELKDIHPGSPVALPRRYGAPVWAGEMTEEQATLLGLLIGNGWAGGSPSITTPTMADAEMISEMAAHAFGLKPYIKPEHLSETAQKVVLTTGRLCGAGKNPVTSWLRDIGAWKRTSIDKRVPGVVFGQSDAVVRAFLRGYFHADGTLVKKKGVTSSTVKLCTISRDLAYGVQHLLTRLGIVSGVRLDDHQRSGYRTIRRDLWTVQVTARGEVTEFMSQIGFLGEKHAAALPKVDREKTGDAGHWDRLPPEVSDHVRMLRQEKGLSHTGLGWRDQGRRMSRMTAGMLAERLDDEWLAAVAASDVLWDDIVSVEPDGTEMVYDITVADLHNFCVDGFVTHNSGSIEQDADIILFPYRHEYYLAKEEPVRKAGESNADFSERNQEWINAMAECQGTAEIIIAKFRQGKTDSVRVAFDGVRTRFHDLYRGGR